MQKRIKVPTRDFKEFLLEKFGFSYNFFLTLPIFYQEDLKNDFQSYLLNGSITSEYGLYLARQHNEKIHQSDFTKWLKSHSRLSHSEFVALPLNLKIEIYNNYWSDKRNEV